MKSWKLSTKEVTARCDEESSEMQMGFNVGVIAKGVDCGVGECLTVCTREKNE